MERKQQKSNKPLSDDDKLKYEIAEELGLLDKALNDGWKTLSAKESGRIGGIMAKRKRDAQEFEKE